MTRFIALTEEENVWLYVDINHTCKEIGKTLINFALDKLNLMWELKY